MVNDAMSERIYRFLLNFAANRDISIVYFPLRHFAKYNGLFFSIDNCIFIDQDLPLMKKCFVLAHELGHYMLHRKEMKNGQWAACQENENYQVKKELEADRFAESLIAILSQVTDSDLDFLEDIAGHIVMWSPKTCQRVMNEVKMEFFLSGPENHEEAEICLRLFKDLLNPGCAELVLSCCRRLRKQDATMALESESTKRTSFLRVQDG